MLPSSSQPPEREWFQERLERKDADRSSMYGDTAWVPALDSHWETVGGLVLTVTDHTQHDTTVSIHVTIENQHQRHTRIDRVRFASAVARGLFTRIEHVSEAGNRALSPQATERQGAIRQLCRELNEHSDVSCARIEDYDHHILLAFDVPLVDEPATVPGDIHALLTAEQFMPLFDTAPDDTVTGSLEYTRDGWAHHRYVAVDESDPTGTSTGETTDTESITGRIDLEIDAGAMIGAYTGLPDPANPYIPLVTAFDLPATHEQAVRNALGQANVSGREVVITLRTRRSNEETYYEVVLTPAFSVEELRDTTAEHIADVGGTIFVRGGEMDLIVDSSLTYTVRIVSASSSRSSPVARLVKRVLTALPDIVRATLHRWRPGTTFTSNVAGIRMQTHREK